MNVAMFPGGACPQWLQQFVQAAQSHSLRLGYRLRTWFLLLPCDFARERGDSHAWLAVGVSR